VTFIKGIVGAAAILISLSSAQAGYVVDLTQQGSDVVATGRGAIDLTGLSFFQSLAQAPQLTPVFGIILTGGGPGRDGYIGGAGPANFGTGLSTPPNSTSGDAVGIGGAGGVFVSVPTGYVSDSPLSSSATWDNGTFSSLGATPGTYEWTWGVGANQNFTLVIGSSPAAPSEFAFQETPPESGSLGHYTITNNSADWWITGFDVENPRAGDPFEPSTTQTDWTASICDNCFGALPAFSYTDSIPSDYPNYIGPDGGQSSSFFFGAPPASRVVLDLVNVEGQTSRLVLGAPEPSTWAMMLLGFAGLGFMRYQSAGQRRQNACNA
jgi:PEP-CTERM motif